MKFTMTIRHQGARYLAPVHLILCSLVVATLLACGDEGCKNVERQRVAAPDARHDAVVFERACGATTAPSTQLSIVERGGGVDRGVGNTLVTRGALNAVPVWENPSTLRVHLGSGTRIIGKHEHVGKISVRFEEAP